MTLFEPWVIIRLAAAAVAAVLFAYGAVVGARILRHAHLEAASEGQLSLERQFELAGTLVRVGAVVSLVGLVLSILAADRLSGALRGAMCGYAVFDQNRLGWPSLAVTLATALAAGVLLQVFALDRRVRGLDLMRPLARGCMAIAPLAALDFGLVARWLTEIDLSVVASCCSTTLDAARREGTTFWQGPRVLATWGAAIAVPLAAGAALLARRYPGRRAVALAGAATIAALPLALAAAVLEVAPHVYEVPVHLCPFCLFKVEGYWLGYPLFGALFSATTWGIGAATAAAVARGPHARDAFPAFARSRMARQAIAWSLAFALGSAPPLVYAATSPEASLFP